MLVPVQFPSVSQSASAGAKGPYTRACKLDDYGAYYCLTCDYYEREYVCDEETGKCHWQTRWVDETQECWWKGGYP
jgi:hypothetical protein